MKISKFNYNIFNYSEINLDKFPFTFRKYYVDYVNNTIHGDVLIFEFEESYICFSMRTKFGFKFLHLISEIFSLNTKGLSYQDFYIELEKFCVLNKIIAVYPPQHLFNYSIYPKKSTFYSLGIICLSLAPSIEDIFSNFKPVYRRHIRNAEKSGVAVEVGSHLFEDFYDFYKENMLRNEAVYDKKDDLNKILNLAKTNATCAIARLNGKIESVILNLHDDKNAYYMWGASSKTAHNGSFRLLHWHLIQFYKKNGILNYSLGGYRSKENKSSKQEKLENFKLGFGAEIKDGFHFVWVLRPLYYFFYNKSGSIFQI
jgi:hypothetical protein